MINPKKLKLPVSRANFHGAKGVRPIDVFVNFLADSIYNILIFFAEKNVSSFRTAKATHIFFFQQKNSAYLRITRCKF